MVIPQHVKQIKHDMPASKGKPGQNHFHSTTYYVLPGLSMVCPTQVLPNTLGIGPSEVFVVLRSQRTKRIKRPVTAISSESTLNKVYP